MNEAKRMHPYESNLAAPPPAATPEAPAPAAPAKISPAARLKAALLAARTGLQRALRALIFIKTPDGNADRNALENAFEAIRNELGHGGTPRRATLADAAQRLTTAAALLANHSSTLPQDLIDVRTAAHAAAKALDQIPADAPDPAESE
jgi:hypothetical protein